MNISILGCGWLGLPLAEYLIAKGHSINGSTTTKAKLSKLEKAGITPYLLSLDPELQCSNSCDSFWNADILILNIPPGRGRDNIIDYHLTQIKEVIKQLKESTIKQVIFVSSTSVYPSLSGVVEEKDAIKGKAGRESGNALLQAEALLQNEQAFDTTIVRFGGLYGYDRHPARYLAGRENLGKAKAPVNLIHRDDCIQIITTIIEDEIKGEVFNGVSDGHPPREMYYTAAAKKLGLTPPSFKEDPGKDYKVVSNRKLKNRLNYRFKYPNPMNFED